MSTLTDGLLRVRDDASGEAPIRLLIGGDFCPRGDAETRIRAGETAAIFGALQAHLPPHDLFLVNLETPLTEAETPILKSGPALHVHPATLEALTFLGVDVAVLANNHIADQGSVPVLETMALLERAGIRHVGTGATAEEAARPLVLTLRDTRIAILAYAENEFTIAGPHLAGAAPLHPPANIRQIRAVAREADVTLVLVHGGNEFNPLPSPRMRDTYRAFAEAGASAVICGHPHCPQGIEDWGGVPIAYSLGNLYFPWLSALPPAFPMWTTGYLARLTIRDRRVQALDAFPVSFEPRGMAIDLPAGDARAQVLAYLSHLSALLTDDAQAQRLWEAWCAKQGPDWMTWVTHAAWPLPDGDADARQRLMHLRNLFACEAHHELASTFLELVRFDRLEAAGAAIPELETLMRGEVIEKLF